MGWRVCLLHPASSEQLVGVGGCPVLGSGSQRENLFGSRFDNPTG